MHDCNLAYFTKTRAGKKERYYHTPDYLIGNQPHMAKFKVVHNVRLFSSYSVDSLSQRRNCWSRWRQKVNVFAHLTGEDLQEIIDNKDLWGMVKQIQHGLFREVIKITGPSVLDAWDYFLPLYASGSSLTHPTPWDQ